MKPTLYIIIPCYNEEEVLPETIDGFTSKRYKYGKIALTVYRVGEAYSNQP